MTMSNDKNRTRSVDPKVSLGEDSESEWKLVEKGGGECRGSEVTLGGSSHLSGAQKRKRGSTRVSDESESPEYDYENTERD